MPIGIATRLNSAVNDALRDPEFRRQTEVAGGVVGETLSLAQADQFLKDQVMRFQRVSKAIKLEPQ
jgi:tripartite-type tricarboxylate transporter receptor subunit TctC